MNVPKGQSSITPPDQVAAQQARNIPVPPTGQTPPLIRPGEESQIQYVYPTNYHYQIPYPTIQPQLTHDISKHPLPQRMPNPVVLTSQAQTMYGQHQGMRPTQSYYPANAQNMRPNRNFAHPMPANTQQSQAMYTPVMYMPTTQPGPYQASAQGTQVIIQPSLVYQTPGQRMPTPPYSGPGPTTQPITQYQIPSTSPYMQNQNPNMFYNTQSQTHQQQAQMSRPTSAPGTSNQQIYQKREKTVLTITDPNTGKDLTEEILHRKSTTPPQSEGSSSRATPVADKIPMDENLANASSRKTPLTTVSPQKNADTPPPQNEIAAQFAAQVAATLGSRPDAGQQPLQVAPVPAHIPPLFVPPQMPPQAAVMAMPVPPQVVTLQTQPEPPMQVQANSFIVPVIPLPTEIDAVVVTATESEQDSIPSETLEEKTPDDIPENQPAEPPEAATQSQLPAENTAPVVMPTPKTSASVSVADVLSSSSPPPEDITPIVVSVKMYDEQKKLDVTSDPIPIGVEDGQESLVPTLEKPTTSEVFSVATDIVDAAVAPAMEITGPKNIGSVVNKKDKPKKKLKELNKKGEEKQGTDFDVFLDNEPIQSTSVKPSVPSVEITITEATPRVDEKEQNVLPSKPETTPIATEQLETVVTESSVDPALTAGSETEIVEVVEPIRTPESSVSPAPTLLTDSRPQSAEPADEPAEPTTANHKEETAEIELQEKRVQIKNEKNEEKTNETVKEEKKADVKMELQYTYKEDQWSPINQEGKRQYDREFLLTLQFATESTAKPQGLPILPDVILERPHHQQDSRGGNKSYDRNLSMDGRTFDFTPGFVKSTGKGPGSMKRGSQQGPRGDRRGIGGQPQKIITITSITMDGKLHQSDKAWKPERKQEKGPEKITVDTEDTRTQELEKKVRSILNKLTPQRFQTLVKQMESLNIDSEQRLKVAIDLIFEKAISEPGFSVAYANMCKCLMMYKVPSESKKSETVNFRVLLLTKCQKEFEKDTKVEADLSNRRKLIEEADTKEKAQKLKAEYEAAEAAGKNRSIGNIRFIGELFKLKMLTETIMHDCVYKLLRSRDTENLECLCRLLTTIGKELDLPKAKSLMDQYFSKMIKIIDERKTSARVRFMLQDVIELRKKSWVPRRDDNNPKTIDEIHQEIKKENQEKVLFIQNLPPAQQQQQQQRRGRPRGGPGSSGGPPVDDGWNTVSAKTMRPQFDMSKFKITKSNADENISLMPTRVGWGRGSSGGGSKPFSDVDKPAPSNRFSALSKGEDDSRNRGSFGRRSSPATDMRSRTPQPASGHHRGKMMGGRSSQEYEREREKSLQAARSISGNRSTPSSAATSRENSRTRDQEPAPAKPSEPDLSEQEVVKKTKSIMDEYLHIQDLKEAIECVKEMKAPQMMYAFVDAALNHVLERSEVARQQTGHLLHDLVKRQIVHVDMYIKGLSQSLEFAEDMEIDIPKIWQYFGELIGPMIQDGSVPLNFLKTACVMLKASNKAGLLASCILHDASHRLGHLKVGELWRQSGLQWRDFLADDADVQQFIVDKKLEFTQEAHQITTVLPLDEIQEKLFNLLLEQNKENEAIFDWIEDFVPESTTKEAKFIRILMTAVCLSAISGQGSSAKVQPQIINKRYALLQKYLDHQANRELQAVYALQALVHRLEHPAGVLQTLFDSLYDEDLISEDAFNQWENSEDPLEQEGKGVALKQVVQFFTWLREANEEEEES